MYFNDKDYAYRVEKGEVFIHFKGTIYVMLCHAVDVSNNRAPEQVIVYANTDPTDSHVFVRDAREFYSEVDKVKYPDATQKYRFEVYA